MLGPESEDAMLTVTARFALRELVDAYALAVDRGAPREVASLFAKDGRLVTLLRSGGADSPIVCQGRDAIASALSAGLTRYLSTMHIVGSHHASVDGSQAVGEASCLAHHLYELEGERRLLVMAVHYEDRYVIEDGRWRFEERRLSSRWRRDTVLEPS